VPSPFLPKAVGLTPKDFTRLATVLKRVERAYRNDGIATPPPYPVPLLYLIPACATGGIPHRASAQVTLCDPEAGPVGGDVQVEAFNPYTADCPAGAFLWITPGNGGYYAVVWDCQKTWD
jgi:hypothetical protein